MKRVFKCLRSLRVVRSVGGRSAAAVYARGHSGLLNASFRARKPVPGRKPCDGFWLVDCLAEPYVRCDLVLVRSLGQTSPRPGGQPIQSCGKLRRRGWVAQWQSKRLIIARSLVQIQPQLPPGLLGCSGQRDLDSRALRAGRLPVPPSTLRRRAAVPTEIRREPAAMNRVGAAVRSEPQA